MVRKNLKVPESLFRELKDDKKESQSWPEYLEEQCLDSDRNTGVSHDSKTDVSQIETLSEESVRQACATALNEELNRDTSVSQDCDTDGIQDELAKMKRLIDTIPERTAEEFGNKYR